MSLSLVKRRGKRESYKARCAALGPERVADIYSLWVPYFRERRWAQRRREERLWAERRRAAINFGENSSNSSDPAPREETGLLSPGASRHGRPTEQQATATIGDIEIDPASAALGSGASVQQNIPASPAARVSRRSSSNKRSTSSRNYRKEQSTALSSVESGGGSFNISGTGSEPKRGSGRVLAYPKAPSRFRKAASCPSIGRSPIPLTFENLQFGMLVQFYLERS